MWDRLAATLLIACAMACVPDPNVDPCRGSGDRPASCDVEDAGAPDADAASAADADAARAADADAAREPEAGRDDGADAQVDAAREASVDPPLDAGPGPGMEAAVRLDTGVEDASRNPQDEGPPDAAEPRAPRVLALQGDLGVHDPTIIAADGTYTIIATGRGLSVKRSTDLITWSGDGRVFATNPAWIASEVAGVTDLWAPDIAFFGGKYHLYYSASTFGSRNSCIGHATATDLTELNFVDDGPVICTEQTDDYNAIDPAFIVDEEGTPWLSFGSFWSGIKLIRLDAEGRRDGTQIDSLASRMTVQAIEAPYIVRHGGYYYLFVSFDLCCRGSGSTYRIMVGRSANITGPYVDAAGKAMLTTGGGTSVVLGNQRWRGPGHNAVLTDGDDQYLVYHAYDANNGGAPTLRIAELFWGSDGWPVPVGP